MKTRFILLVTLLCSWLVCSVALAKGALSDEAQKHFDAGLAYADDPTGPKWEEAFKEFRAAYALSQNWKILNNIGLCALNLERDGEAIEAYKDYLSHGGEKGLTEKLRKQIEKDVAMLSASLVNVTLSVDPADAVVVDERTTSRGELRVNRYPVKNGAAKLGLHPGTHKLTIEARGYVSETWSFDAEPGSTHEHQVQLVSEKRDTVPAPAKPEPTDSAAPLTSEPPKPAERSTPTGVYIGLAATGVFAIAATATGVLALGKDKKFNESTNPSEEDDLKKSGKTLALLTDIGIGAAVVSAGITAYLYFSAPKSPARDATATNDKGVSQIRVAPAVGPNAAGVALSGKF